MDDLQINLPDHSLFATLEKAQHFLDVKRYDLAEREIRQALNHYPQEPQLHVMLGFALEGLGRKEDAGEAARDALRLDPESIGALVLLAHLASKEGRHREAEDHLLQALHLNPMEPFLYLRYGWLMQKTGHTEKAEKLFRRCLELDPENSDAHGALALALSENNDHSLARRHGEHGLYLDPDSDQSHFLLGYTYLMSGRPFKARRHLREALRMEPGNQGIEEAFLDADKATRWIYLPMYYWTLLMQRVPGGPIGIWIVMIVLLQLLPRIGVSDVIVGSLAIFYLLFCIYTWVANPMVKAWVKARPPQ